MEINDELLAFQDLILDHADHTGFALPPLLHLYLAQLLTHTLESPLLFAQPQITDCWLGLHGDQGHKVFADSCLFHSGLVLESSTGLCSATLCAWGTAAYHHHARRVRDPRFHQLAMWFEPLQRFLVTLTDTHQGIHSIHSHHCTVAKYFKGHSYHENQ